MDRKAFGRRLNEARKKSGITAERLSELCEVNDTHIRHIEGGNRAPSLDLLVKLCEVLRVSPNYLLQDSVSDNEYDGMNRYSELIKGLNASQLDTVNDVLAALIPHFSNE